MAIKRIPVELLRLGMYIVGIDRSWMDTPFLTHRFLLKKPSQLKKLKQSGIQEVEIDTDRGADVPNEPEEAPRILEETQTPESDLSNLEARLANLPEALQGKSLSDEFTEVHQVQEHMLHEVQEMLDSVRTSGIVEGSQVKALSQEVIAQTLGHEEAYAALIRTREFSPDLYDHALSVCTLAVLMARLLGYEKGPLEHIAMGALLHDIGFLRLPSELIRPHRTLSEFDQILYDSHPRLGVEILKSSPGISEEVMQMVAQHHLTGDLQIHPEGGPFEETGFGGRLIRVVDEYDELLTGQGSSPPLPMREALGELYLRAQRNQLNPELASYLIIQIGIYPIYSLVELNTGERGIVTAVTPGSLLHPVVLVIQDPNRNPYHEPFPVNFAKPASDRPPVEIVRVLDAEEEGIRVEEVLGSWNIL